MNDLSHRTLHAQAPSQSGVLQLSLLRLGLVASAAVIGVLLLVMADAGPPGRGGPELAQVLLAISFVATLVVMVLAALSERRQFGLMMLTIYFAIFLILPGYHHLSLNVFPFYGMHYPPAVREKAGLMIFSFLAAAYAAYLVGERLALARPFALDLRLAALTGRLRVDGNLGALIALTAIGIASTIAFIAVVGPARAFATRGAETAVTDDGGSIILMLTLAKTLVTASFVYAYLMYSFSRKNLTTRLALATSALFFVLANWPAGQSRFGLFGYVLLTMMLTFDFRTVRSRALIPAGFMFGALVAMPFWDSITRQAMKGAGGFSMSRIFDSYFGSGDFDGLQSINNAALYVQGQGIEHGRQLLTTFLFFVPRSIWSGKAEATGVIAARHAGFGFTNISQPLPGELYVDFGLAGPILGGAVVGFVLARLDVWTERHWWSDVQSRLLAAMIVGYSIIIYRGSLLGIISGVAMLGVILWLVARIGLRRRPVQLRIAAAPAPVG